MRKQTINKWGAVMALRMLSLEIENSDPKQYSWRKYIIKTFGFVGSDESIRNQLHKYICNTFYA